MGNVLSKPSVADTVQAWYRAGTNSCGELQPESRKIDLGSLIPLYKNPAAEDILRASARKFLSKSWIELCEKNDISVERSQYAHDLVFVYLSTFAKELPKDPRLLMWILEDECKNPWKALLHTITRYQKNDALGESSENVELPLASIAEGSFQFLWILSNSICR